MRLLGVPDSEIKEVEQSKKAPDRVKIRSPFGGTVLERLVDEGAYVSAGSPLFHVAELSRIWVQIDAYENDLPHLRVGQRVVVEVDAMPGESFSGRIAFIDPVLDKKKRTAQVRVEVSNKEGQLRPGMFAQAIIETQVEQKLSQLVIPESAPMFTGRRSVVYVEVPGQPSPTYQARTVRLGPRSGPVYPVLSGLSEGEHVVDTGRFCPRC